MATTKLVIACFLSLLVSAAIGLRTPRLNDAQQCRLRRLSATQPSHQVESENGVIEVWDESDEQFQCAGVAPLRLNLKPNSLHMPNFHPSPRLAYVVQGRGLIGVVIPGCPETYTSQPRRQEGQREQEQGQEGQREQEQGQEGQREQEQGQEGRQQQQQQQEEGQADQHQKILRLEKGDVFVVPSGLTHWYLNDDDQENLVVLAIDDLNHLDNQLSQTDRKFYLAGDPSRRGQQEQSEQFQNILNAFNPQLLSEAFKVPAEIIRNIQRRDERGIIVRMEHKLRSIVKPDEEQERRQGQEERRRENGVEENICSMLLTMNVDQQRETDVKSRQAGKITVVDKNKLPILRNMDLSLEKGNLHPNALISPHWSMNSHSIFYVIKGDAQLQVVNHKGQNIMNDKVNEGEMVVIPQYYASTIKAGNNGLQYVAVKTSGTPFKSTLAGYTSVLRAMPLQVVRESYQLSSEQAEKLKYNRGRESLVLSPSRRGRQTYD